MVNAYVPNSGAELARLEARVEIWELAMVEYINALKARGKPVLYCGDLNVAHEEIDLWGNHASNAKSAGYHPRERAAMSALLSECSLCDTFRQRAGSNAREFSYFSYRNGAREANKGWRLDYVLAPSPSNSSSIVDAFILRDVQGSDHVPIGLTWSPSK